MFVSILMRTFAALSEVLSVDSQSLCAAYIVLTGTRPDKMGTAVHLVQLDTFS